jgi:predicted hydrocarbon binding protein
MFKEERKESKFSWENLGNVDIGRPNLGLLTDVRVYRLMQFTLRDVLIKYYGVETTNRIIAEAGYIAGIHFCRNLLNTKTDINGFLENLRKVLLDLHMGILRIEKADLSKMHLFLTISEDLDCSGLPVTDETVCDYDEGFIAGILKEYSGEEFSVKEIDCWSNGDRVCRFEIKPIE